MRDAGITLLSPVKRSLFPDRRLATSTTNVAQQRRLDQAAAQRRRRVCCAQSWLDAAAAAEHGATLQLRIEYLPPSRRLVSLIPQLS